MRMMNMTGRNVSLGWPGGRLGLAGRAAGVVAMGVVSACMAAGPPRLEPLVQVQYIGNTNGSGHG